MNVYKGIVAILIFAIIFIGAWWIDHQSKQENDPYYTHIPDMRMYENKQKEPFNPREYVRIRPKKTN